MTSHCHDDRNGEALRPEQGYPARSIPGWEGNMGEGILGASNLVICCMAI